MAGAGHCLDSESRVVDDEKQYLILDFDVGEGHWWNAYEGCCEAAGKYYAMGTEDPLKADDDYHVLLALQCQQYWVLLKEGDFPGAPGWEVEEPPVQEVPKPKP